MRKRNRVGFPTYQVNRLGVWRIPSLGRIVPTNGVRACLELTAVLVDIKPENLVVVAMRIEGVRAAYGGMEVTPPHLAVLVGQAARPDLGGPDFLALNCPGARAVGGRRQSEQPAVLSVGHTVVDSGDLVLRCACIIVIVQRVDPLNATHRRLGCYEVGGDVGPVLSQRIGSVAAVVVDDAITCRYCTGKRSL